MLQCPPPGGVALSPTLLLVAAVGLANAQSPAGGANTRPATAPKADRVDGRYTSIFDGQLVEQVAAAEPPAIPDLFRTRTEPCFVDSQRRQPGQSGRVDLSVTLHGGALTAVSVLSSSLGDVLLNECLVERATGLVLADLQDGTWTWGLVAGGSAGDVTP